MLSDLITYKIHTYQYNMQHIEIRLRWYIDMKRANVEKKQCVACGECAKACPKTAVSIHKGCYAVVDYTVCVGCGICGKNCPTGAIRVEVVTNE